MGAKKAKTPMSEKLQAKFGADMFNAGSEYKGAIGQASIADARRTNNSLRESVNNAQSAKAGKQALINARKQGGMMVASEASGKASIGNFNQTTNSGTRTDTGAVTASLRGTSDTLNKASSIDASQSLYDAERSNRKRQALMDVGIASVYAYGDYKDRKQQEALDKEYRDSQTLYNARMLANSIAQTEAMQKQYGGD